MKRFLVLIGAAALAVSSSLGAVVAQTNQPLNANGSYVVANDDGVPIVSGRGEDISYGNIDTGGDQGEVLGDPSALMDVPDHPGPGEAVAMPGAGDGLIGGVPIQPGPPDATTATMTNLATTEGTASENVPLETVADESTPAESAPAESAPAESAPAPSESDTASDTTSGGFCAQYGVWYDAQVAYENLGATAADPALVQEVDPDYDGIACEEMMV